MSFDMGLILGGGLNRGEVAKSGTYGWSFSMFVAAEFEYHIPSPLSHLDFAVLKVAIFYWRVEHETIGGNSGFLLYFFYDKCF